MYIQYDERKMVNALEVRNLNGLLKPKLKSDFFCTALFFFYFAGHLIAKNIILKPNEEN